MSHQDFYERVQGLDLPFTPKPAKIGHLRTSSVKQAAKHHISFSAALLIGIMSALFARFVLLAFMGVPASGQAQDLRVLFEVMGGAFCVLAVRIPLKAHHKDVVASHFLGVLVTLLFMHNWVHLAPDLWTQVFGAPWVQMILDTTEPGSVLLGTRQAAL